MCGLGESMHLETKFLRLKTPVTIRFGGPGGLLAGRLDSAPPPLCRDGCARMRSTTTTWHYLARPQPVDQ